MITADEARNKLGTQAPNFKHLDEKMTKLIEEAIQKGLNFVNYNLAELDEEPYWKRYTRPASCHIVCEFAKKYGYKASKYSDNKRVQISW